MHSKYTTTLTLENFCQLIVQLGGSSAADLAVAAALAAPHCDGVELNVCLHACEVVCMFICIYTQTYVCIHACTHKRMYIFMHARHACMRVCMRDTRMRVHIHARTRTLTHTRKHASTHARKHASTHARTRALTHMHTHTHTTPTHTQHTGWLPTEMRAARSVWCVSDGQARRSAAGSGGNGCSDPVQILKKQKSVP
jgi:hypothetical protein